MRKTILVKYSYYNDEYIPIKHVWFCNGNLCFMMDALMQNVHAVHICNWDEYVSSLRPWLPWIVAYDNNRYGRWLPDFWAMLTALPADQVAFLRSVRMRAF